MEESAEMAKAAGRPADAALLCLALNSLQRLHASQLRIEESEEEEKEERKDDYVSASRGKFADAVIFQVGALIMAQRPEFAMVVGS